MEKNTLTFDNTGFSYDISNPTQQTEELSYILKNALLATSPLNIRQYDDEEWLEVYNRILDIADELCNIVTQIEIITQTNLPGIMDKLQNLGDQIENLGAIFYPSEEENILSSLSDIAASSGIFMDAPGLSIIDKPELQ
jgi:hypothetical protein